MLKNKKLKNDKTNPSLEFRVYYIGIMFYTFV